MKTIPLGGQKWRVFMDTQEYRTLLKSAYSNGQNSERQVRLEMRLLACSLRVDTASNLRWGQFERRETPEGIRWVVKVEAKDSTDREAETRPRAVYVPQDIMQDVQAHVERKSIGDDDLLFPCSTKTIYRDVKRSAANAVVRTDNDEYRKLSPHDLRRYFATHLLFRHEVPAPVVRVLGGWKSDEAMFEYLILPDDVLFESMGDAGLLGTSYDKLGRHDHQEKIEATADRLEILVSEAETVDVEAAADGRLGDVVDGIDALTVGESAGTTMDASASQDGSRQQSFNVFLDNENGAVRPATVAKAAYVAAIVVGSWSVTLAPLVVG